MQPISRPPQPQRKPARFGSSGSGNGLPGVVGLLGSGLNKLHGNETNRLLLEDVVGFGLLRTGIDYHRGKMYGNNDNNLPAAAERFAREMISIFTDNIMGGLVALGVGAGITKWWNKDKTRTNLFTDYNTLELFKGIVEDKRGNITQTEFLRELAKKIDPRNDSAVYEKLQASMQGDSKALQLAAEQKWDKLDRSIPFGKNAGEKAWFQLDNLFDDAKKFVGAVEKTGAAKETQAWGQWAQKTIKGTFFTKNAKMAVGLSTALGATFGAPFLISAATKKFFNIDYYPGEIGLRQKDEKQGNQPDKSFVERHFPYVSNMLKNGNPLPLLGALVPIPFALGIINTQTREWIKKPFQWKNFRQLMDFAKTKPFTGPQQMAAGFALLITSRLLNARTDNEYQERVMDSFLGWGLWIFGTPLLKELIANRLDNSNRFKTALLKKLEDKDASGKVIERFALRSESEINHLLGQTEEAVINRTKKANILIGGASLATSMILLGVITPLLGIKLTQLNERRKQRKQGQQPPIQPTPVPAIQPPPFQPFQPLSLQPFQPLMAQAQPNRFVPPTR